LLFRTILHALIIAVLLDEETKPVSVRFVIFLGC
jgi:hypothetical protein